MIRDCSQGKHDPTLSNEKNVYDNNERRRSKKFRRGNSDRSFPANYLDMNKVSELQREEYWEDQILNEFELDDDRELPPEDFRNVVCDMLAKEP